MNLDFSMFLLDYTERFFLKISDIVNLSISLIAIFVGMVAIIISVELVQPNSVYTSSGIIIGAGILIIGLPSLYIYHSKMKKNHEKIFKIEDTIIQNYDYINGKNDDEKNGILEELRQVFTKKKEIQRLIVLLSESGKN